MEKLILILLLSNTLAFSQRDTINGNAATVDFPINTISVLDSSIYETLDSVLNHVRTCAYYSDTLPFGIRMDKVLTNTGDTLNGFSVEGNVMKEVFLSNEQSLLGYIYYKGHYFFIRGINLFPNYFRRTESTKIFPVSNDYMPHEDDSWAEYFFVYSDNTFVHYQTINDFKCQ